MSRSLRGENRIFQGLEVVSWTPSVWDEVWVHPRVVQVDVHVTPIKAASGRLDPPCVEERRVDRRRYRLEFQKAFPKWLNVVTPHHRVSPDRDPSNFCFDRNMPCARPRAVTVPQLAG